MNYASATSPLSKRGKPTEDPPAAIDLSASAVEGLSSDNLCRVRDGNRQRLRGRDEEDWLILGAALSLVYGIWTKDTDFIRVGAVVRKTDRMELFLGANAEAPVAEDE